MDVEPTHEAKEADMPVEQPPPPTAQALLEEARSAWRMKGRAESELARLRRYTRLTKPMKRDQSDHYARVRQAEATLSRILGGRPEGRASEPSDAPAGAAAPATPLTP